MSSLAVISPQWDCKAGTPEEDHEWEFQDDSFDHEFGTERVHYWRCVHCDTTRGMEQGDYHDHDDNYF